MPAIGSGGAVTDLGTTVLMTVEDTMAAPTAAQQVTYRPPGA